MELCFACLSRCILSANAHASVCVCLHVFIQIKVFVCLCLHEGLCVSVYLDVFQCSYSFTQDERPLNDITDIRLNVFPFNMDDILK